ncbi:MAG TPA: molybdopterin-guanine dinucleotide biosynthesis protein MobB [Thermoanaerobaculia bacterium]|nr:molybdopterin-guanine dinucleotide biosynthesis protein MobB [Thermoanaerobaculia bacterium]
MRDSGRTFAFAGFSRSGKTTLICELVRHWTARGRRIGVIKHSHHPIESLLQGDSLRFLEAGAHSVLLVTDHDSFLMDESADPPAGWQTLETITVGERNITVHRGGYTTPSDLPPILGTATVLIEGFKTSIEWRRIAVEREGIPSAGNGPFLATITDHPRGEHSFRHDEIAGLAAFLDRITI